MNLFRKSLIAASAVVVLGSGGAMLASAAAQAATPLGLTLSADSNGDGSSAVYGPAGQVELTVGADGSDYAQAAVDLSTTGTVLPSTAPTFDTNNYNAGSPRWVIELGNGNILFSNQTGVPGAANGWEYNTGTGWQGYGDTYAQAAAAADLDNASPVTAAYIVEDTDQSEGTTDVITGIQYNGQSPAADVLTVTNPGPQTITAGVPFSLQIQASTTDGNTITWYGATGLPAGLSINSSTGLISGTPTTTGSVGVEVKATDGALWGKTTFSVDVIPATALYWHSVTHEITDNGKVTAEPAGLYKFTKTGVTYYWHPAGHYWTKPGVPAKHLDPASGVITAG